MPVPAAQTLSARPPTLPEGAVAPPPPAAAADPLVVIVGAGVTGLTTALALVEAGARSIEVHERRSRVSALAGPGGILVQENAIRALAALPRFGAGLIDRLAQSGRAIGGGGFVSRTGRTLFRSDGRKRAKDAPAPGFAISRGELQQALFDAVEAAAARAGARVAFRFRSCLVRIERPGPAAVAHFADGSARPAAAVVGADGAHSAARVALGRGGRPRYSGQAVWIGSAPAALTKYAAPSTQKLGLAEFWGERASRFGYFAAGPGQLCWYAMARAERGGKDGPAGPRAVLRREFCTKGYEFPKVVEAIIDTMDERTVFRHDVCDRDPPPERWGNGAVTLAGDAAHPMYPSIGQGACIGIEDAVTLAAMLAPTLSERRPVAPVLREFEKQRTPRVTKMVNTSRLVAQTASLTNPIACFLRDLLLFLLPQRILDTQFDWMLTEFQPPALG